ncbi:MAG: UDP-3-O-(3-hydroxymyristoyl)glucosamine N-acyltransferase [Arcobacteraceae bacterium]|jgi:UDP-3-O-[3-hydroxymyristoyl] glucosamine N-acyltransferase|nr:UDP-3-O-(3-hydroxymyristoyl)glucosamine N-acyltransferase [Arcobacteraceae bacterium]
MKKRGKETLKLQEIIRDLKISCDKDIEVSGLNTLKDASPSQISFLENKKYLQDLKTTQAGAVFVTADLEMEVPVGTIALVCENPYIALAISSKYFAPKTIETEGTKPVIGENTVLMDTVTVGKNASIGKNSTIMAGVFIGDNVTIGDNVLLYPNVVIYRDCIVGNDVIIHSGTVVGSDGFGFAHTKEGKYIKIYQNGNVVIGNDVEIGANCAIDRAAFASTKIENGARLDNLIHIAHNCIIGKGSILTGQVGLAGSTILKEYVVMAGQSAATGHLEIAPFTTISARGVVSKTITEPKKQWAGFPLMEHKTWLKLQSKISRLLIKDNK